MTDLQLSTRRPTALVAGLIVMLCVSGCDAEGDPLAVIVAEETRGALALDMGVPALPELARAAGVEDEVAGTLERWNGSWGHPDAEGRRARRAAYDEALPVVAASLDRSRVSDELERLRRAVDAARQLTDSTLPAKFRTRIAEASELELAARTAFREGRTEEALRGAVAGGDLLREIGPRNVALYLVDRASVALERARSEGLAGSERDARRGSRMVMGAREALEQNDFPLAIRRAYYACHLLGVQIDL